MLSDTCKAAPCSKAKPCNSTGPCSVLKWLLKSTLESQLPETVRSTMAAVPFDGQDYLNKVDKTFTTVRSGGGQAASTASMDRVVVAMEAAGLSDDEIVRSEDWGRRQEEERSQQRRRKRRRRAPQIRQGRKEVQRTSEVWRASVELWVRGLSGQGQDHEKASSSSGGRDRRRRLSQPA